MRTALEEFNNGNTAKAIQIYGDIIKSGQVSAEEALLNRASAYYSIGSYVESKADIIEYLDRTQKANVQGYIIFANNLIKTKALMNQQEINLINRGKK